MIYHQPLIKQIGRGSEEDQFSRKNIFSLMLAVFIIALGTFFLFNQFIGLTNKSSSAYKTPLKNVIENALQGTKGTYAIVIKDFKSAGESYYLHENKIFKAASLYKLWVMATTFKQIEKGQLKEDLVLREDVGILNTKFGISSGSAEIKKGTVTLTVADALNQMIVISHNLSALLLTEKIKLSSVADFLKEAGLSDSKVGIEGEDPVTSAADTALFFEKLYKGELANEENTKKMMELLKKQQLNDKIPKNLPGDTMVAHKTGELDWFNHDGGIVFAPFGDYIIVVLSETDYPPGAEERIAQISQKVYEYFKQKLQK